MKLLQIFVIIWVLLEITFLFPILYSACQNVDSTLTLAPLIKMFPYIFLIVFSVIPVYFGFKGK